MSPLASVLQNIFQYTVTNLPLHAAMAAAESMTHQTIILDLQHDTPHHTHMPLLQSLKSRCPTIPIIAIIAYGNVKMAEQVIHCGADDYLSQPIALERLKVTLRNSIRLHHLLAKTPMEPNHSLFSSLVSPLADTFGNIKTLKQIEDDVICYAIRSFDGCITQAARALGIGRSTLYRKLQERLDNPSSQISLENQTTRPMMLASSSKDS